MAVIHWPVSISYNLSERSYVSRGWNFRSLTYISCENVGQPSTHTRVVTNTPLCAVSPVIASNGQKSYTRKLLPFINTSPSTPDQKTREAISPSSKRDFITILKILSYWWYHFFAKGCCFTWRDGVCIIYPRSL